MPKMDEKEWTLMFYFASDNPLAPEIVSQLKSIKQAGFHDHVNVIAQFDPNPETAATHIFDVNRINKIKSKGESKIGFVGFKQNDPYVVNLMTDKLWRKDAKEGPIRKKIIESLQDEENWAEMGFEFDPPEPPAFTIKSESESKTPDELPPRRSLEEFLRFCREHYPARHYILFIVGHGLVVGNDTFLFDEHAPEHTLMLGTLGTLLRQFNEDIKWRDEVETGAQFELISFHSCSMSSVEVAFELRGTANYMLASQSPSFVGSWPYRQILIRMFNYLQRREDNVKKLLKNFFHYCLYNAYDFLVAGYSSDLCLCDLNRVSSLEGPLSKLSMRLKAGLNLKNPEARRIVRERILLAHLDAQSYFNETYVDIFDFCFRLKQRFQSDNQEELPAKFKAIVNACKNVMKVLKKGVEGDDDRLIVRSDFVGPVYQYSHGLSIFFPWSKPIKRNFWPVTYNQYKFVTALGGFKKSWSGFLADYFDGTRRQTRVEEFTKTEAPGFEAETKPLEFQGVLLEAFATGVFNGDGQLGPGDGKPGPGSSLSAGCDCQSIKNYPAFTRASQSAGAANGKRGIIPVSPTFLPDPSFTPDDGLTFALDGLTE
jgi:hypothetical protein